MTAAALGALAESCRITCLKQVTEHQRTYWTAHVTVNGETFDCHNKWGSWFVQEGGRSRHVLPAFAARLQERVRADERKLAKAEVVA